MYGKIQESGLIEIIPLICTIAVQGQYPGLSHPESLQGAPLGAAVVARWLQHPLFTDMAGSIIRSHLFGAMLRNFL